MNTTPNRMLAVAVAAALLTASHVALAQDKISLRAADYLAPTHYLIRYGVMYWIEQVAKQSNGRIEIKHFPSEQLGKAKDMLLAHAIGGRRRGGHRPELRVGPHAAVDDCRTAWAIQHELPRHAGDGRSHDERRHSRQAGTRAQQRHRDLHAGDTDVHGVFQARQALVHRRPQGPEAAHRRRRDVADPRQAGRRQASQMATPEIYESLARGTVEGVVYAFSPLFSGGLQKLVKSSIADVNFGGASYSYVMNRQKFSALPRTCRRSCCPPGGIRWRMRVAKRPRAAKRRRRSRPQA